MTLRRRARTKQYARGYERDCSRITSAMQIVALRETPTRQWTRVDVPARRPRSEKRDVSLVNLEGEEEERKTY